MEVEVQNTCDNPMDSLLSLCENQKERRWEDVIVEQMCVHSLPHHSTMVEIFDEGMAESRL